MIIKKYDICPEEAVQIRLTVFVDEQGFQDEFDEIDKYATHLVAFDNDKPIATCRVFKKGNSGEYFVGRLAVLSEYRGKGIGAEILHEAEKYVSSVGGTSISLHSQCRAQSFYEKCGFTARGDIEYEESCPHIWMTKEI